MKTTRKRAQKSYDWEGEDMLRDVLFAAAMGAVQYGPEHAARAMQEHFPRFAKDIKGFVLSFVLEELGEEEGPILPLRPKDEQAECVEKRIEQYLRRSRKE